MEKILTWNEMKRTFPDEWLLITDFVLDQSGHLISGVVARHSVDKDEVYRLPALDKPAAFKYTGESTFPVGYPRTGLGGHSERLCGSRSEITCRLLQFRSR